MRLGCVEKLWAASLSPPTPVAAASAELEAGVGDLLLSAPAPFFGNGMLEAGTEDEEDDDDDDEAWREKSRGDGVRGGWR